MHSKQEWPLVRYAAEELRQRELAPGRSTVSQMEQLRAKKSEGGHL